MWKKIKRFLFKQRYCKHICVPSTKIGYYRCIECGKLIKFV